jgi:hypothetical protein
MSKFKDRLWRELVRDHGAELAQLTRPAAAHGRRARPRVLAGTTLGLAGVGATLTLILTAASTTPAFAVTQNRDGSVSVKIMRLAGIQAANAKLHALGVRAQVVQVSAGCTIAPLLPPAAIAGLAAAQHARIVELKVGAQSGAWIDPRRIPLNKTLVLPAARVGRQVRVGNPRWAKGAVPVCHPWGRPVLRHARWWVQRLGTPGPAGTRGTPARAPEAQAAAAKAAAAGTLATAALGPGPTAPCARYRSLAASTASSPRASPAAARTRGTAAIAVTARAGR